MPPIHNPHDRFVRRAFTHPQVATRFFERYLPAGIAETLDLSALHLENDTFVDEALQLQQSDLLFTVPLRGGGTAKLYILLEHKSHSDIWVPAQLFSYLDRIWTREREARNSRPPLTPVIPVVLFHGESAWSAVGDFRELVNPPPALARCTPGFQYLLCDLNREVLDDLQQRTWIWLAFTLQVLKFSRSDELSARLPEIVALMAQLTDQWDDALAFLATALRYLATVSQGLSETTVREALHNALPHPTGETLMSTLAEIWTAKGVEQGIEQGKTGEIRQSLLKLLNSRFGPLPASLQTHIQQADYATLSACFDAALSAPSLATLFPKHHPE